MIRKNALAARPLGYAKMSQPAACKGMNQNKHPVLETVQEQMVSIINFLAMEESLVQMVSEPTSRR